MKLCGLLLTFTTILTVQNMHGQTNGKNSPQKVERLVIVGDSLSAGVQNFSLLDTQQPNGYPSIIAKQAGWLLTLPLVPYPGVPSLLQLTSLGPPIVIEPVPDPPPNPPRDNPFVQPTNIAVPGLTIGTALTLRPSATSTDPETQWATVVLGFPSLLQGKAPTEIELANSLNATTLIEWLGNNDALVPALAGQLTALTPVDQFKKDYKKVLDSLQLKGVRLITATIPDVTEIAYFTSAKTIAQQANLPLSVVTSMLGIKSDDAVRPSAAPLIDKILTGAMPGPLPATCPAPLPDLGVATLPCVLTAADARKVRAAVECYNDTIAKETRGHQGLLIDIHALVDRVYSQGYRLPGTNTTLTTDFLGGLFSLDGIHPSNTGYGIIANQFITDMNSAYHTRIPQANINDIYAADPLKVYASPHFVRRPVPPDAGCNCKN
jgi:phospholipase/lecithinase/hemolysin